MKHKRKLSKKSVKTFTLIAALIFQTVCQSASAENLNFLQEFQSPFAKNLNRTQFEIGINIPLGRSNSFQLTERPNLYASYFLPGQNQNIGIGFSRSFGIKGQYQYATRFRDSEHEIDMSLPLYTKPVFNASTTGTTTSALSSYSLIIGAGLLLLAAAGGGGGGDEDTPQITTTSSSSSSAVRRFEQNLSLPICSPIPPADGNEQPCRVPI